MITGRTVEAKGRYGMTKGVLPGEQLLYCTECGALISDAAVSAHDHFHAALMAAR